MNSLLHVVEFTNYSEQTLDYMIVYSSNYTKNRLTFNIQHKVSTKNFKKLYDIFIKIIYKL